MPGVRVGKRTCSATQFVIVLDCYENTSIVFADESIAVNLVLGVDRMDRHV